METALTHRHDVGAQERPSALQIRARVLGRGRHRRKTLALGGGAAGERRGWPGLLAEAGHLQEAGRGCTEVPLPEGPAPSPAQMESEQQSSPTPSPGQGAGQPGGSQAGGRPRNPRPCPTGVSRLWERSRHSQGLPRGHSGKESTCQCRRCRRRGFDPWVGKIPQRKKMATHSSIIAWRIPRTEEPRGLQSTG